MATIIRGVSPILSEPDSEQANRFAINYWGEDLTKEKWFPIPFWQLGQLFAASTSNTVALRVVNINRPNLISTKWMVFEEVMADSLQDPNEQGVYYFLLEDKTYYGPILTTNPVVRLNGLYEATSSPAQNILRGRIGKDDNGDFYAFFQVYKCEPIGLGGGGGGALTGAKISKKKK